jgi:hypothetical protein
MTRKVGSKGTPREWQQETAVTNDKRTHEGRSRLATNEGHEHRVYSNKIVKMIYSDIGKLNRLLSNSHLWRLLGETISHDVADEDMQVYSRRIPVPCRGAETNHILQNLSRAS